MFEAFITLFTEADWLFYVLFALTIFLFVIEVLKKGFGIAGIAGIIMAVSTITERCTVKNNTSTEIIFYMLYIYLLFFLIMLIIKAVVKVLQNKKTIKFATINGNKVPLASDGSLDYSFLIGEEGEVLTDLKPTGKVKFEKGTFEVTSTREYIHEGSMVKVDRIFNGRIIVKKK